MSLYALTIFTGAFLLFLVQPLIGKYILPWFGGAPAVWTTCMLFFQLLLLAGYAYAHFSARWLKPRVQAIVQLILLIAAMALLGNITPSDSWKPTDGANPTLRILGLLLASIGLPYFVLASTSPLMQHWFSRTHPGVSPFRLYALSNVGSMLALLSFPIYFETHFTRPVQAHLWGAGLALFAISCGCCAWKLWQTPQQSDPVAPKTTGIGTTVPPLIQKLLWLLLPACASTLLLATTNMLCQEVAVIPFLWVLPLALYLLSFIICFDSPRWYMRLPFAVALIAALGGTCWMVFLGTAASMYLQLFVYPAGLFICCMVCHGELYRLRPDPRHLTGFYLMIAAGGALGGLFVAILAPLIFNDYYELHWGLFMCGLLFLTVCFRDRNPASPKKKGGAPRFGSSRKQQTVGCALLTIGLAVLGVALWMQTQTPLNVAVSTANPNQKGHPFAKTLVEKSRNFYGVLAVYKHDDVDLNTHLMEFAHGRTLHGMQFTDSERSRWPTAYFSELSGIGLLLNALPAGHRRIGVVGLGAGTLAAYPRPGDYMHMYEINPEVLRVAEKWFTYLTNCPGKLDMTLGDARLSLETEPPQDFDLLVLDAFNSDAPPVHLLTKEAFTIYERHLKTNGMIAVNVSNKRINLDPVIANIAREFNYKMVVVENQSQHELPWIMSASWILLARDETGEKIINSPTIQLASRPPLITSVNIPLWTDDFASLFQILRSDAAPQVDPTFTDAQCQIAFDLYQRGDIAGAIAQFRSALKTLPRSPFLLSNLGFLLATCPNTSLRNLPEATLMAEKACQLTHFHTPAFLSTLGVIYSETGRFEEAILMAKKACALATDPADQALVEKNQELIKLYRTHRPYHEMLTTP